VAVPMDGNFPSLEGIDDIEAFSALMMRFANQQLARGPDGYRALLLALGSVQEKEKELKRFFQDEAQASKLIYPWVKFLVDRDEKVLDLTEYVYKTMAEQPAVFEGMDDNPLEVFTEGVAFILPGAVPPERMNRFRAYAQKILDTPKESQPKAIQGNRRDIERALSRIWSVPLSDEEAMAKLKQGGLDPGQAMTLLKSLKPEQLAGIDVTALLMPVVATGNYDVIRALRSMPKVPLDLPRLDSSVMQGMAQGAIASYFLPQYFDVTGREEWTQIQSFFDSALAGSEESRKQAAYALSRLNSKMRPDKAYVEDVLRRYDLDDNTKSRLKRAYGLK
jgi:hypothetical protein